MINQMIFLLCLFLIGCTHSEQKNNDNVYFTASSIDTAQVINKIERQYKEINAKIILYDKIEKEVFDETTEGALLTGYYEKGKLKKISGKYYRETGKTLMEYYYDGSNFFFVYSKIFNYEKQIYIDTKAKVKSIEENKFYFYRGDLIKWIANSTEVPVTSDQFLQESKFLKEDFEKYRKMFVTNYK